MFSLVLVPIGQICGNKGGAARNDLNAVAERLLDFQYYWETTARPFQWKFTRQDLTALLVKLRTHHPQNTLANF